MKLELNDRKILCNLVRKLSEATKMPLITAHKYLLRQYGIAALLVLASIFSPSSRADEVPAQEYVADSHTTLLCHFNSASEVTGLGGIIGANVQFVAGKFGNAAQFVLSGDYISFPASSVINQSQGTIEMFAKSTIDLNNLISPANPNPYLFHMYTNENNWGGLLYNVANKTMVARAVNGSASAYPQAGVAWKAGEWHHIAFTWGNGAILLYIDGNLVAVQDYAGGFGTPPARFYIGNTAWANTPAYMVIDELRVSNICREFQPGEFVADANTKLLCHLNSSSEVTGLGGTVSANVQFVSGRFANAAQFNATGDKISFPASGRINASQGTVEMYIQPAINYGNLVYPADPNVYFFHMYTSDSNWVGLFYNVGNKTLVARAVNGSASACSQAAINWYPGDWHHVAFTWGNGNLKLYIDDKFAVQQSFAGGLGTLPSNLYVGNASWNTDPAHAAIDELRIYNTPLDFTPANYSAAPNQVYFYPDELTSGAPVLPVINVNTGYSGTLRLKITKNSASPSGVITDIGSVSAGVTQVTLQAQQLSGNGAYTVETLLTPASGATLRSTTAFVVGERPAWPAAPSVSTVSIGDQRTILVNGSSYFPVIMYHALPGDYADLSYLGFNSAITDCSSNPQDIVGELNDLQASGMLGIGKLTAPGYGTTLDTYSNIQAKVSAIKNHPALMFYSLLDEPAESYYTTLAGGYNYVKGLDGNHPQYCTLGANLFTNHEDQEMDTMAETRDIIVPDVYPFDSCDLSWVSGGVEMCVAAASRAQSAKSVIYVGPCFQSLPTYRLPEPNEVRLVAYLALINGAKGLSWYSYRESGLESAGTGYGLHVSSAAKTRSVFKQINYELSQIYPAICAANPTQYFSAATNGNVQYILKDDQSSHYYLITANQDKLPRTVTFTQSAGIPNQSISILSEDRTVTMSGGAFTDSFEPYAVHVYIISK